jgi:hypothetical protein
MTAAATAAAASAALQRFLSLFWRAHLAYWVSDRHQHHFLQAPAAATMRHQHSQLAISEYSIELPKHAPHAVAGYGWRSVPKYITACKWSLWQQLLALLAGAALPGNLVNGLMLQSLQYIIAAAHGAIALTSTHLSHEAALRCLHLLQHLPR